MFVDTVRTLFAKFEFQLNHLQNTRVQTSRNRYEIFIRPIYSFKCAYNHNELYFCQILTESAVFSCQNRLYGAKLCPASGPKFKDLVTSLVVFTQEAR